MGGSAASKMRSAVDDGGEDGGGRPSTSDDACTTVQPEDRDEPIESSGQGGGLEEDHRVASGSEGGKAVKKSRFWTSWIKSDEQLARKTDD